MPIPLKSKGERVKETIEILKQLQEVGIVSTDPSYAQVKSILDSWIADGESRREKVEFPRAMRVAEMVLPRLEGRPATFVLRATDELRELWRKQGNQSQE